MSRKDDMKDTQIEKMGELGTNIPVNDAEKEEDLLEMLYSDWREGKSMLLPDVRERAGLQAREIRLLVRRMVRHGYVLNPEETGEMVLTALGKSRGADCISRHRVITQFIQMVSGQSSEKAEAEACRLEHVVSRETVDGLGDFIRNGDGYDRVFTDTDLCLIASYEDGTYDLQMGLYYSDRTCPRVLVQGYDGFGEHVRLSVEGGYSVVLLPRYDDTLPEKLWYVKNGGWECAGRQGGDWVLPTRAFQLEKSADLPIIEATLTVALPEDGQTPIVLDCMELNVHIW